MAEVDHFYITRKDMSTLRGILHGIPALVDEIAIVELGQSRLHKPGLGNIRRPRKPGSRAPINEEAFDAREGIWRVLTVWCNRVAQQRHKTKPYVIGLSDPGEIRELVTWLTHHMIDLGQTEPPVELNKRGQPRLDEDGEPIRISALDNFREWSEYLATVAYGPEGTEYVHIDERRIRGANNKILTAGQIEKVAQKLGETGRGLDRRRVQYLDKLDAVRPCSTSGDTKFYRLGDVLDAHNQRRKRRPTSA